MKIGDFEVKDYGYDEYKDIAILNALEIAGMCYIFASWLRDNHISEDTMEEVYENNTSGLRDGIRLDIIDNYILDDDYRYEISSIWSIGGCCVYVTIYDNEQGKFIGDIKIN